MFKKLLFSFSLANVVLFPFWSRVYSFGTVFDESFYEAFQSSYERLDLLAGLLLAVAGTGLIWLWTSLRDRWMGRWLAVAEASVLALAIFAVLMTTPAYYYDTIRSLWPPIAKAPWQAVAVGGLVAVLGLALRFPQKVGSALRGIIVLYTPAAIVIASNALYGAYILTPKGASLFSHAALRPAPPPLPAVKTRVVMFIFDELDQRLTYEARPADVEMPAFDAMKQTSFYATDARPPFWYTYMSVARLMTGDLVSRLKHAPGGDVNLWIRTAPAPISFREAPSILSDVRSRGGTIGIFGQIGFAYCELFYDKIEACWDRFGVWQGQPHTFLSNIPRIWSEFTRLVGYKLTGTSALASGNERDIGLFKQSFQDMEDAVSDPKLNFVYLHVRMPHDPFIYNRHKNDYDPNTDPVRGYLDNLELTDRYLQSARTAMEKAGLWDRTTVIVTADHWWRISHKFDGIIKKRVPFLVKLPGQTTAFQFDQRLKTIGTRNLIRALFDGKVTSPDEIAGAMQSQDNQ